MTEEESTKTESFPTKFKSGVSNLGSKIKSGTKNFITAMKKVSIIQLLVALILLVIGVVFTTMIYGDSPLEMWLLYLMILVGVVLSSYVWIKVTRRFLGRFIYLLCEHKYTRKIIAGGSFSYFEYKDPAKETTKSKFTEPLGITITSLITLLGFATTIIGVLRSISDNIDLDSVYLWGAMAILAPLLATPVIPIIWALDDAKVKAWNSRNNTTWTVSSKYKRRFNSIIAISAVISNIKGGLSTDVLTEQIPILFGILKTGGLVMLITMSFFIIYYYAYFRSFLRTTTTASLNLTTYEIKLIEKDVKQFESEIVEKEKIDAEIDETIESEEVNETEEKVEEIADEVVEAEDISDEPEATESDVIEEEPEDNS